MHKNNSVLNMCNELLNVAIVIAKIVFEISNLYVALSMCKSFIATCLCAILMIALHEALSFKIFDYMSNGTFGGLAKEYFDNVLIGKDNTKTIEALSTIKTKYNNFVLAAYIVVFCVLTTINRLSI